MEQTNCPSCVLLDYKIPREPTASRAMVWRKLKRLGALLLHDAVWVLPATPWTREQFQWLAVEIGELGGEAHLWESHLLLNGQAEAYDCSLWLLFRQVHLQEEEIRSI